MSINWQDVIVTVITTVGGGTVLLGGAAWLIQTALTSKLTRDLEAFKAKLKADGEVEMERLKASLQKIAFEDQVRFSKLHEKRAEIIADIYAQMVDVEKFGQRFVFADGHTKDEQKRQDSYIETHRKLQEFYFFVEKHGIYLPKRVYTSLTAFADTLKKSVIGIGIYAPIDAPLSPSLLEERRNVVMAAVAVLEKHIPAARADLEQEFRHILGAEQDQKSE